MKKLRLILLVILLAGSAGVYIMYTRVHAPFQGYSGNEQFVEIPAGVGSRGIADRLIAAGVVRDSLTYRIALWMSGEARRLKAGEYRFDRPMTPREVIDKMARGDVYVVVVTFPEGLTMTEMSKIFESRGLGTSASFVTAAHDGSIVGDLDPVARDLEGYLFPDTYSVPRKTEAVQLVHLMVGQFEKMLTPALRALAAERGLSVRQLVTLASIIEKETARPEERPLVASVYANRLKIGMGLQCDPTVIYALTRAGTYTGNLRRQDLSFDSPYNTYRYAGLPPGPIAAPGQESLEAAAHPADTDFLYFVSRNDGSHAFARTLDEHNRNVQTYQVEYFRAQRSGVKDR